MICTVREPTSHELRAVISLIRKLFPSAGLDIGDEDLFFIAEAERRIVGFLHMAEYKNHLYVKGIGIHPDYQNKGYGSTLMAKIDEISSLSAKKVYLKVKAGNPAILLYEQFGFMPRNFGPVCTLVKKPNN